jgi:hypothetical protein
MHAKNSLFFNLFISSYKTHENQKPTQFITKMEKENTVKKSPQKSRVLLIMISKRNKCLTKNHWNGASFLLFLTDLFDQNREMKLEINPLRII